LAKKAQNGLFGQKKVRILNSSLNYFFAGEGAKMAEFIEHPLIRKKALQKREYQEELANNAWKKGNTLVVAPTALGKTIVAVLLAAFTLKKHPKAKVLILAPTKPLAVQHYNSIKKMMLIEGEKIALLTGTIKPKERAELFNSTAIISATPQCIRNDAKRKRISLESVRLCIFDEAHRAVGNYSYVPIAKKLREQSPKALVLGLTASPGHEREHIEEIVENLGIKNIEIKSHEDANVKEFVNEIKIEWDRVLLPEEFKEIISLLKEFMQSRVDTLKKMGAAKTDNLKYFNRFRLLEMQKSISARISRYGKRQPSLFAAATKVAELFKASHAILLIETQGVQALNDYFDRMLAQEKEEKVSRALKTMLKDVRIKQAIVETRKLATGNFEHPKLSELKIILEDQFRQNPNSRVLVFNHYRDSGKYVVKALKTVKGVKPLAFIGQASRRTQKGMTQKEQALAVKEFEKGKHNVLVATSVAEEGLDIPSCDLVVFYEPVPSEIRHIQRRGRTGRIKKGRALILMALGTRDEAFYWSAHRKEKKMARELKKMQSGNPNPKKKKRAKEEKQKTLYEW